jgi:uncharacterized protein
VSPQFVIPVKDLESGARDYAFPLSAAWLDGALRGCELEPVPGTDGHLAVHASQTGQDVLLDGTVRAQVFATCCRCLEPARIAIDAHFEILMVRRAGLDESRFEDDDADWEVFDGDRIVLDDLAREQILLDVPMNPLCAEDCGGIPLESRQKN